jgi:hypothetical protein
VVFTFWIHNAANIGNSELDKRKRAASASALGVSRRRCSSPHLFSHQSLPSKLSLSLQRLTKVCSLFTLIAMTSHSFQVMFPPEIWRKIFSFIQPNTDQRERVKALHALLLASRFWKVRHGIPSIRLPPTGSYPHMCCQEIAEHALMEKVVVTSYTQLSLLERHLTSAEFVDAGTFVQEFIADLPFASNEWTSRFRGFHQLMAVILSLPNLRAFRLDNHYMRSSIILSLYRTSTHTLTILHMMIDASGENCIPLLAKLTNLTELKVYFSDEHTPALDVEPPVLPGVDVLTLEWPGRVSAGFSRFLSGSRFLNASSVTLIIPRMADEHAFVLADFLENSVNILSQLTLRIPRAVVSLPVVVTSLYEHVHHVAFPEYIPPPSFVKSWRSAALQEISVLSQINDADELWEFLRLFKEHTSGSLEGLVIHVHVCSKYARFTWRGEDQPDNLARFVGKITPIALRLIEKGITIQDEDDMSVVSLGR